MRSEDSIPGSAEDEHLDFVDEDMLEKLYWEFDSEVNGKGDDRLAFKAKMRFFARFCGGNRDIQRFSVLAEMFADHAVGLGKPWLETLDDVRGAMDYIIEQRQRK